MLRDVLAEVLALLVPPCCAACRAPLDDAGELLCRRCRADLPWLCGERCRRCALPLPCAPCPARGAAFEAAWSPLAHSGTARPLVSALKFRGALPLAEVMAAQIAAGMPAAMLDGATLVPVPAHARRRKTRGFDQAERLARALAARCGAPLSSCLRRVGAPTRQLGAGRAHRLAPGRISVAASGRAPPRALLVDDVHTTGATLDACAQALRAAGAGSVEAVTYARALLR